jgi:hypothetical protein
MDELLMKLRLLAKAEMILFRLNLRRAVRQAALSLAAVLLAVLAVGMLNVAIYQYLAPRLDGAGAALAVALADLVIAAAVLIAAGRQGLGNEYDAANALREVIVTDLTADADRIKTEISELHDNIRHIRAAATGFLNPGGINLSSIVQWLTVLFRFFQQRKDA